jgi:hypothetical protein
MSLELTASKGSGASLPSVPRGQMTAETSTLALPPPRVAKEIARAIAGPAIVWTALQLRAPPIGGSGGFDATTPVLALAMLFPALYVATALFSIAPPAAEFAKAVWTALGDASVVLLGLSPALAFLLATTVDDRVVIWAGAPVCLVGALFGFRSLYLRLFDGSERPAAALMLFGIWTTLVIAVSARVVLGVLS